MNRIGTICFHNAVLLIPIYLTDGAAVYTHMIKYFHLPCVKYQTVETNDTPRQWQNGIYMKREQANTVLPGNDYISPPICNVYSTHVQTADGFYWLL